LKGLQEKKYTFPDSDLLLMLDDLLEGKIIELPTPKQPEEAGRIVDLVALTGSLAILSKSTSH